MGRSTFQSKNQHKKAAAKERASQQEKVETPGMFNREHSQSPTSADIVVAPAWSSMKQNASLPSSNVKDTSVPVANASPGATSPTVGAKVLRLVDGASKTSASTPLTKKSGKPALKPTLAHGSLPSPAPKGVHAPLPAPPQNAWNNKTGVDAVKTSKETVVKNSSDKPQAVTAEVHTARKVKPSSLQALALGLPLPSKPSKQKPKKPKKTGKVSEVSKEVEIVEVVAKEVTDPISSKSVEVDLHNDTAPIVASSDQKGKSHIPGSCAGGTDIFAANADTEAPQPAPQAKAKKNKKSGSARKKEKAARLHAEEDKKAAELRAAEAERVKQTAIAIQSQLAGEVAAGITTAIKAPFPTDTEKLEKLADRLPGLLAKKQVQHAQLTATMQGLATKNIDVSELRESSIVIEDVNKKTLSEEDQAATVKACKAYKEYQMLCVVVALAKRAEKVVRPVQEKASSDADLAAMAQRAFAQASGKDVVVGETVTVETNAGLGKAQDSVLHTTQPNFDFLSGEKAPVFGENVPGDRPKIKFATKVFGQPDTPSSQQVSTQSLVTEANESAEVVPNTDCQNHCTSLIKYTPPLFALSFSKNEAIEIATSVESATASSSNRSQTIVVKDIFMPRVQAFGPACLPAHQCFEAQATFQSLDLRSFTLNSGICLGLNLPDVTLEDTRALPVDNGRSLMPYVPAFALEAPDMDSQLQRFIKLKNELMSMATFLPDSQLKNQMLGLAAALPATIDACTSIFHAAPAASSAQCASEESGSDKSLEIVDETEEPTNSSDSEADSDKMPDMSEITPPPDSPCGWHICAEDEIRDFLSAIDTGNETQQPLVTATRNPKNDNIPHRAHTTSIGIFSLNDFFAELADSSPNHASKLQVVSAFIALSAREREELGLGGAWAFEVASAMTERRLQHKVKLGSVKLMDFLKEIVFVDEEASHVDIVKAFEKCAEKDVEAVDERLVKASRGLGGGA